MRKFTITLIPILFFIGMSTNLTSQNAITKPPKEIQNPSQSDYSYLHYDNGIMSMGYGLISGGTFYCASYWPSSTMNQYIDAYLTDVLVAIGDVGADSFTLYIWDENTSSSPGSVIYSQQFFPSEWSWNTVTLSTPVLITGNDLWVGFEVLNHPSGDYPAGIDAGPAVTGYGDLWSTDGINFVSINNAYGHNYNFNILAAINYDYKMPSGTGNSFTGCHFNFYDDAGQNINYSNNFYGVTTIYPNEPSKKMKIIFDWIGIESDADILNIYDGNSISSPLITSLSGVSFSEPPYESTALDGSLTFEFISNETGNGNGWSATLYCVGNYPPISISPEVYCQTYDDYISYGETKLFEIYMLASESYNFSCCSDDFCCSGYAGNDADFRMFDATLTEIWYIDGESTCDYNATTYGTDFEDWSPPNDGYYYLEISENNQYPMIYQLAYKRKGVQLTPLGDCQTVAGSIGPGEGEWYGLSLYSSESYNFSTCETDDCPGNADGSTDLSLYDESGSLIWHIEGSESCNFHASTYGTLYENWYPPSDGCYLLFIDENGPGTNTINFTLSYVATCTAPSELQATNITQTSADLVWTENGNSTSWDVEIGFQGFIPTGIPTHSDILSIPFTWTEGTSNTNFDFYVRSNCGDGDYSGWIGPNVFKTLCDPYMVPIYEGFDGVTEPDIPECWLSLVGANTTYGVIRTENYQYVSPPNSIRLYVGSDLSASLYIISPQVYNDLTDQMILFQAKTSSTLGESSLTVGTMSNPFDEGTFNPVSTFNITDVFEEYTVYLNSSSGGDSFVAFKNGQINHLYESYYIDDIYIQNKPSCPPPENQSEIIVTNTSVDLYWTENGEATMWEVEFGESGFVQGTGTTINNISTIPYSLYNLIPDTTYDWYVRSNCGGGEFSTWTGPATFVQILIPPNDECVNSILIPEPYPQTVNGTTIGATEDCLNFPTVWYEVNLPYDLNDIEISFCPTSDNLGIDIIGGVFKYAIDCECNLFNYNVYDWNLCMGTAPTYWFYDVTGPNTIYLPIIIQTDEASGLFETDFSFNIDVMQAGGCDISTFPYSESFETGIGEWHQISGDDFNWTRYSGSTPSSSTGPSAAYDGSYYLYLESSSPNYPNKTARLETEICFSSSGLINPHIEFAYHMYGSTMGTLSLQASLDGGNTWDNLWSISGNQGNTWLINSISLAAYAGLDNVLIRFWGETGSSYWSDMAIDYIHVNESCYCTSSGHMNYQTSVTMVDFNTLHQISGKPSGYSDYTSIFTELVLEESYDLTVNVNTDGNYSVHAIAWVDWNQDCDFDDAGEVFDLGSVVNTPNGPTSNSPLSITIPSTAQIGSTRMRVSAKYYSDPSSCENNFDGEVEDYSLIISSGAKSLDLTVFLEGPFNGTGMNTDLTNSSSLPNSQPYNIAPWNYPGSESLVIIPTETVDWVLVELHDAPNAASVNSGTLMERRAALLISDGSVVDTNGTSNLVFEQTITNQLFVIIRHRNHLDVLSANSLTETSGTYLCNFSTGEDKAFGGTLGYKELGGGVWGMVSGDTNADGLLNDNDGIISWSLEVGKSGYLNSDVNLNGQSNNQDKNDYWFINRGIYSSQAPN